MIGSNPARAEPEIVQYGESDQQVVELWAPHHDQTPRGFVILIHGGYWRAEYDATLMHPLAYDLLARGWAVANIEYRSVGNGGGWPITLDDVRAAIQSAKAARPQWCTAGAVISVGHSVGGQLALLTADLVDAVVGLAPLSDVRRADAEQLDDNAALGFMGAHYADMPDAYDAASPVRQLPLDRPLLVIHGDVDIRVPEAQSADFAAVAVAAGDAVEYRMLPGLGHMDQIDPVAPHWAGSVAWMEHQSPNEVPTMASAPTQE